MNILRVGSGGREHALAWKIKQSQLCDELIIAPGNAGTMEIGENVELNPNDFEAVKALCLNRNIALVVVGPEDPLVNGIYDFFQSDEKLKETMIIGPSKAASQLEGSKSFAKGFMKRHNIPTAGYAEFDESNFNDGLLYLKEHATPIVLKADGLAAGKGVLICKTNEEAIEAFTSMIRESKFGKAGKKLVVEEFLDGIEMSAFVLTDGKHYVLLPEAKDYKRIGEGDTGLNTGGMGAVSPVPFAGKSFMNQVTEQIIKPTIKGLSEEKLVYKGIIFIGLIMVKNEPFVIEYNCRFGDPETEVILVRLQNDLVDLFVATHNERLNHKKIEIDPRSAATVVSVSGGYPEAYKKGDLIELKYLNNPETRKHIDEHGGSYVFHAGTKIENETLITNGGRIFAVSSLADSIGEAVEGSLELLSQIYYDNMYYRTDIGKEFLD
ncbi:MAG: phosphoribosylamine--glycine ligase [Ginsengibacter sp.]